MKLSSTLENLTLDETAASAGLLFRCAAANFRWEPAVSDQRTEEYVEYIGEAADHADWKAEHQSYLTSCVQLAKDHPKSSECFLSTNRLAHLNEQLDNTYLLRLESLGHLFTQPLIAEVANAFWQRFFNSQRDLGKTQLETTSEALREQFVTQWNAQRTQARPLFATFLNDFGGDLKALIKEDWPHRLRDRLGLTHWPSTLGRPLPVALIVYTLNEVRQARASAARKGAVASFSRPTVLDGEMSTAFIPAPLLPNGESYGYTLDLANGEIPTDFTPELLTFPIEYQPKHIKALGFITRPHALKEDAALLAARNRHIAGLQALPGCADFGEVMA